MLFVMFVVVSNLFVKLKFTAFFSHTPEIFAILTMQLFFSMLHMEGWVLKCSEWSLTICFSQRDYKSDHQKELNSVGPEKTN